jgi:hypothetical protein
MTSDAFRPGFDRKPFSDVLATAKLRLVSILTFIGYSGFFVGYAVIFLISLFNLGFLEIRQANIGDFNALVAVVEQRDRAAGGQQVALHQVRAQRDAYRSWIASFDCFEITGTTAATEGGRATESGASGRSNTNTPTCAEIKEKLQQHANQLALTEDDIRFGLVGITLYFDQYVDGIIRKAPQMPLVLWMLDSGYPLISLLARSPALNEMFLVICMGVLGGVTSVMRCFVDPSLKKSIIGDFFYKPLAGAVISLGIYVLFRAAQIFLGVQNQDSATAGSTSIFVLAGLGLASGFCAIEALGQIEAVATRLLRGSGRDANGGGPAGNLRGSTPNRGEGALSGSTADRATLGSPR